MGLSLRRHTGAPYNPEALPFVVCPVAFLGLKKELHCSLWVGAQPNVRTQDILQHGI